MPRRLWRQGADLRSSVYVNIPNDIYGASPAGLIGIIRGAPSAAGTVVVVGHDPAFRVLALVLAGTVTDAVGGSAGGALAPDVLDRMRARFPAAAIAVLEVREPGPGSAQGGHA